MKYNNTYYTVLATLSTACTLIANALGGLDMALQMLLAFMAIDYLTGIAVALIWKKSGKTKNGSFKSDESIKGLFRKMAYLVLVFIAVMLDATAGADNLVRNGVIFFFIANDGFSILENFGIMGVPYPEIIKNSFEQLKSKT